MSQSKVDLSALNASLDAILRRAESNSDKDQLRSKVFRLVKMFNGGETTVKRYGFTVDIFVEFEKMMGQASPSQVTEALRVLRD